MDAKARVFAARRAKIKLLVESAERSLDPSRANSGKTDIPIITSRLVDLRAEDATIARYESDLQEQRMSELARNAARSASTRSVTSNASRPGTVVSRVVAPTVRHIAAHAGEALLADRHDNALCLFRTRTALGSDVAARPVLSSPDLKVSPLMERLLAIVEIPGLAHTLVLAERRQRQVDVETLAVPAECRGLPAAPAFAPFVFSARALTQLLDPDRSESYLTVLRTASGR